MSSFPFPDFPSELVDRVDDSNQQSPTSLGDSLLNHIDSASPPLHNIHTPAESVLSIHYQSSNPSELENGDESYFNGIEFNARGGNAPSFLGDDLGDYLFDTPGTIAVPYTTPEPLFHDIKTYPISPDHTPSIDTSPPRHPAITVAQRALRGNVDVSESFIGVGLISPCQLKNYSLAAELPSFNGFAVADTATQLTPETTSSGDSLGNTSHGGLSREEGRTYTAMPMAGQNPDVTVSQWDRDDGASGEDPAVSAGVGLSSQTPASSGVSLSVARNQQGAWVDNTATGLGGIDPSSRLATEVTTSVNEDAEARKVAAQNKVVSTWLDSAENESPDASSSSPHQPKLQIEGVSDRDISLGDQTQNVQQPGRTYYTEGNGPPNATDYEIMLNRHTWEDAPMRLPITQDSRRRQPESSQAAIERFERMYLDNVSVVSRAATWGTRRRSLPSVADMEGITSGNFLKKLSLSGRGRHRPSIFGGLRTLVKMPSTNQQLKRSRTGQDDDKASTIEAARWSNYSFGEGRRDSKTLVPPSQTQSTSKNKQHVSSIDTALVSVGSRAASIGTTHARSGSVSRPHTGSVSLSPPLTSPKSPLLKVSNSILRPRSKSEQSEATRENAQPNLVRMLMLTGGPPVANLATGGTSYALQPSAPFPTSGRSHPAPMRINTSLAAVSDPDDEDDKDDDGLEDGDVKTESDGLIYKIAPDLNGFRELVLALNPALTNTNSYLADRIAYQQIQRYKSLLSNKVKHLGCVSARNYPSGSLCIEQGGGSVLLDSKGDLVAPDQLSTAYDASDIGDLTSPLDGAVSPESFPRHIPMPPTSTLPAEFECQLCFQNKRFQKPSDWTKHVHEDVQPFTCTWDRCREPKMFKRKADWVRHENEGHRHLEWWTCDVEECRHTCYRRDNFLQHLVREHKFVEPKNKTKAAIKKAGATDPTWKRVEQCHTETRDRPQDEPCKFCGKTFPTWKKLTVHLAKHMEHISLPILKLVDMKELDADTLISPVQEPPVRTFASPLVAFLGADDARRGMVPDVPTNLVSIPQAPADSFRHTQAGPTGTYIPVSTPDTNAYAYPAVTQAPSQGQYYYGQPRFVTSAGISMPMQSLDVATMNGTAVPAQLAGTAPYYGHSHLPVTTSGYHGPSRQFISDSPDMNAAFYSGHSAADANALGLQASLSSGQIGFESGIDPLGGSASPYSHSPHQGQGQFYR